MRQRGNWSDARLLRLWSINEYKVPGESPGTFSVYDSINRNWGGPPFVVIDFYQLLTILRITPDINFLGEPFFAAFIGHTFRHIRQAMQRSALIVGYAKPSSSSTIVMASLGHIA